MSYHIIMSYHLISNNKYIRLSSIRSIEPGISSDVFQRKSNHKRVTQYSQQCFTITCINRTLDFQCDSIQDCEIWVNGLIMRLADIKMKNWRWTGENT